MKWHTNYVQNYNIKENNINVNIKWEKVGCDRP